MKWLPSWKNAFLALLAAGLLILAFPDFEWWWTAWFALVPLMWAVERETVRGHSCPPEPEGRAEGSGNDAGVNASRSWGQECPRSFLLGWLFGTAFFFGTCWWLTYAPIHYAGLPWPLAYFLILIVCLGAGIFPGIFAAVLSILLKRFGSWAFIPAPFIWVFSEFLRYWLTGNNWNALAYSQALVSTYEPSFYGAISDVALDFARLGGVFLVGFIGLVPNSIIAGVLNVRSKKAIALGLISIVLSVLVFAWTVISNQPNDQQDDFRSTVVIAIQPNVPMSGVDYIKLEQLRQRQFDLAEAEIKKLATDHRPPTTVILPESPMNFMYNDDREFQAFVREFTTRNNVSLIFNSAEPDATNGKYFNSAMMIGPDGKPIAQYDKIYLLPFGEAVPVPFESIVPAFVGNFSYGREYDLLPFGEAKGGIMICFESHFGALSREYVKNGADVLIEMTNDGYLGPTPVLRQHLANAVFRAVETNRPVLRVTNVGITTYIDERGNVIDPLPSYTEGARTWSVSKSDGSQTFYVKYGDWFAWLCSVVTLGLVLLSLRRRNSEIGDK